MRGVTDKGFAAPDPRMFRIGLNLIDEAHWIEPDDRLASYLAEKERLSRDQFDAVFADTEGTERGQAEVLSMLAGHLTRIFPKTYRQIDGGIEIVPCGRVVTPKRGVPDLFSAAQLVADDLLLMRRGDEGWELAAACVCFPSSWRLGEKISKPLEAIHAPVPGFGPATRNAAVITRMFDNMRPGVFSLRWNWSIYGDDQLHHPHDEGTADVRLGDDDERAFVRMERQTLTRLPGTGDILFTVKIIMDPLVRLEHSPEGRQQAAAMARELSQLDRDQLAYKGLTGLRDGLVMRLNQLACRNS